MRNVNSKEQKMSLSSALKEAKRRKMNQGGKCYAGGGMVSGAGEKDVVEIALAKRKAKKKPNIGGGLTEYVRKKVRA